MWAYSREASLVMSFDSEVCMRWPRRQQKVVDEGGRRHQRWWLLDDHGHEHLAVTGAAACAPVPSPRAHVPSPLGCMHAWPVCSACCEAPTCLLPSAQVAAVGTLPTRSDAAAC